MTTELETIAAMAVEGAFARMWGRLYDELLQEGDPPEDEDGLTLAAHVRQRMDRIMGEEITRLKDPAARPAELTRAIAEATAGGAAAALAGEPDPDAELCLRCRLPGGHHADDCPDHPGREGS